MKPVRKDTNKENFVRRWYLKYTNVQMANALRCEVQLIRDIMIKLDLKREDDPIYEHTSPLTDFDSEFTQLVPTKRNRFQAIEVEEV